MSKNVDKKVELKDYLYVAVMFIITIIAALALRCFHASYEKYDLKNPVIRGKVQELHVEMLKRNCQTYWKKETLKLILFI